MDYTVILTNALNYFQANYLTILTYLAAGGGVSAALQLFKKLRKWERGAWIQFVLAVFSALAAIADYVIDNNTSGAIPTIFGDMTPKILVAALLMHRIAINPLTKLIEKTIQTRVNKMANRVVDTVSPTVTGQITPHELPAEKFDI